MKTFVLLFILTQVIIPCSVVGDFEFPTLEEQINYAGVVFQGTVVSVSDPYNQANVVFNNVKYYRGCLQDEFISVDNFRGDSLCGAGIPKVGDRIIVFACEDSQNEGALKVNQFEPFSGWAKYSNENIQKVMALTYNSQAQCNAVRKIEKCYNRKTAGWQSKRKLMIDDEPVMKLIEPVYPEPQYIVLAPEPPIPVRIMPRPMLGQSQNENRRSRSPVY